MSGKSKKVNMVTDSPGRALLLFALPMILGNLFQQFYNIVDSVIVGRYVGEEALASVGASFAVTNVFIAIAIGGGVGSAVVVSQFFGAERYRDMRTAISTTLINFLVLGLILSAAGVGLHRQILIWLNTPENVFPDAAVYLNLYFIGLPFLFLYNVQAAVFNSLGDSRTPLYLLVFSSILNIGLDMFFVISMGLGVAGAALATLIAQGVSAVISFIILSGRLRRGDGREASEKMRYYDIGMAAGMMKVALPSTLQQSIVHIGLLMVQSVVNSFGSSVMAGFASGTRIDSICIVPMLAIGNAMSTFTAQNIGAGKKERVKEGYRFCYAMIAVFAVVICAVIQIGGKFFVNAFLDEGAGRTAFRTGVEYISFLSFFYALIGLKTSTDGVLRGSGDVFVFTAANLVNLAIRVSAAFLLAPVRGIRAVWYSVPMGWAANYLISLSRYLSGRWSRVKLIED